MKKKIIMGLMLVFAMFIFVGNVNAKLLEISNEVAAKAPETVPSTDDVLYGVTTDPFDLRGFVFSGKAGGPETTGKANLKKIIIGVRDTTKIAQEVENEVYTLNNTFSNWFTAYCLDETKKYPERGLFSNEVFQAALVNGNDEAMMQEIVLAALFNSTNTNVQNALKSKIGNDIWLSAEVTEGDGYVLPDGLTEMDIYDKVMALDETITIGLKKVTFTVSTPPTLVQRELLAKDITGNASDTVYNITFKGIDVLLDRFIMSEGNQNITGYNHALWIIEHSYPTLSLSDALAAAGASLDTLKTQVANFDGYSDEEELAVATENYVYGIVQYAIWYATGQELGDSMTTEELSELNKLYQYLIADRSEYSGYDTKTYTNKIAVTTPESGKELKSETSTTYKYGPYKVNVDAYGATNDEIKLDITNTDKTGIKFVDESGEEITRITPNTNFYIEVSKKATIGSISAKASLDGVAMFAPATERGRIYNPVFTLGQNVMTGGKTTYQNLSTQFELVINARTGVENVALLLMVTLVAFTLAYLVLSYKNKPVTLS